uniref:Mor transcription activator family protein n=1 Tax=Candidatus Kentrum sp. TC TaxID=2126339 RepID=A0A450YYL5_9GAMM|nr:MAG: Mor transcription activator family protein [Candidatus Kentron sp. TC]
MREIEINGITVLEMTPEESARNDAAILAGFDGHNHLELAKRHRVSAAYVYRLLKKRGEDRVPERRITDK